MIVGLSERAGGRRGAERSSHVLRADSTRVSISLSEGRQNCKKAGADRISGKVRCLRSGMDKIRDTFVEHLQFYMYDHMNAEFVFSDSLIQFCCERAAVSVTRDVTRITDGL